MRSFLKRHTKKEKSTASSVEGSSKAESVEDDDEFHDSAEAILHPEAHEDGGFGFTNKELLARQRGVMTDIIKELGKKLLSGHLNLINVSMPVKLFEPRSYLEKMTDIWVHPEFLRRAAESTDPVDRMQHVLTWYIAGLQHCFQSWQKPFNPILGETFQARLSDGSEVFLEQISHHPPISAFQLDGPDGLYQFSGSSQPDVSFELQANSVRTAARGARSIKFQDGGEIGVEYPTYYLRGLLYTAMPRADMVGSAIFLDKKNKIQGEVLFGKVAGMEEEPLLQRADSVLCTVYQVSIPDPLRDPSPQPSTSSSTFDSILKRPSLSGLPGFSSILSRSDAQAAPPAPVKGRVLVTGTGNWLSHLDWSGERAWTLMSEPSDKWGPVPNPLPSDSRLRKDLRALADGDLVEAQAAKEELENRQREDAKLRRHGMESCGIQSQMRSTSLGP